MKVCDIVLNSVWFDPRVRKQIAEYLNQGEDVTVVGVKCVRYDEERIASIPCKVVIAKINEKYEGKQNGILRKLIRIYLNNISVKNSIISEKPDVIHANDFQALLPAYKAKKKLKCALIYDSHEINAENYTNDRIPLIVKFTQIIEKRLIKKADKMVCVSNAAAEYFRDEYNIEKPMVVTNCSLKSEQCVSKVKNPGFEILNHGQFYPGRGYDIMAEAIPLLKDYPEVKLAVRGFGTLEESLRARVDELKGDNFVFYPKVLVQELIPEASKSMVGVAITEAICLNFKLSISNKLFEYASAGLPVIMSDIPEHRYLNDKYQFGVILSENTPEAFAKAVIKLYTDKDFYNKCAENAKKLSDEVNWENEFGKLIHFERECCRGK